VATKLPLDFFTQKNFVADFVRHKLNFTGQNSRFTFCATL